MRIRCVSVVVTCVFAFLTAAHADYKGINESCNTRGQECRSHLVCKDGYSAMPSFMSGATVSCKQELAKKGVDMRSYVSVYGSDGTGGYCYYECEGMYEAISREMTAIHRMLEINAMLSAVYEKNKSFNATAKYVSPAAIRQYTCRPCRGPACCSTNALRSSARRMSRNRCRTRS